MPKVAVGRGLTARRAQGSDIAAPWERVGGFGLDVGFSRVREFWIQQKVRDSRLV